MGCSSSSTNEGSVGGREGVVNNNNNNKIKKEIVEKAVHEVQYLEESQLIKNKKVCKTKCGKASSADIGDLHLDSVNEYAWTITKYFKNQQPYDGSDLYEDDIFPPNNNSLNSIDENGNSTNKTGKDDITGVTWKRASEIFSGKFELFENTISVDDIKQGSLGNCYFLSAISSMAEHPQLIASLFRYMTVKENGYYEIIMRVDGEWVVVIVDDYIPVYESNGQPAFAKAQGRELWVMILEKAWAKVNGGYKNTIAGLSSDVLRTLTPFNCEYVTHENYKDNLDNLWKKIFQSSNNEDIAGCTTSFDKKFCSPVGIVAGHAYSLLKAYEENVNGKKVRLLYIRNPHGGGEWKGKWSDSSSEWNSTTKQLFNKVESKEDGNFYMEYSDYIKYYIATEICYYLPSCCYTSVEIPIDYADKSNVCELIVYERGQYSISANRPYFRFNRELPSNFYFSANLLVVLVNEDGSIQYINGNSQGQFDPTLKLELEPNRYFVVTHLNYSEAINQGLVNSPYSYKVSVSGEAISDFTYNNVDEDFSVTRNAILSFCNDKIKANDVTLLVGNTTGPMCYGYYLVKNNKQEEISFDLVDKSNNFTHIYPGSDILNNSITLESGAYFMSLGFRSKFFASFMYYFDYNSSSNAGTYYNGYHDSLQTFTDFAWGDEISSTQYIYKELAMDVNKYFTKIDEKEENLNFLRAKYPEEMDRILELSPYTDNVETTFIDKYYFQDRSYFLCECVKGTYKKHGRGIYQWVNGTRFIGYFFEDKFHGEGVQESNGQQSRLRYDNGKFVEWL